ncbi:hypothetical protein F4778DRAFT_734699 [Xylariomycetidae sp. FL2044]|nr:hypothetical protein F4778DRAFT_734699 [Xylariomycetidae sp. FL2044]
MMAHQHLAAAPPGIDIGPTNPSDADAIGELDFQTSKDTYQWRVRVHSWAAEDPDMKEHAERNMTRLVLGATRPIHMHEMTDPQNILFTARLEDNPGSIVGFIRCMKRDQAEYERGPSSISPIPPQQGYTAKPLMSQDEDDEGYQHRVWHWGRDAHSDRKYLDRRRNALWQLQRNFYGHLDNNYYEKFYWVQELAVAPEYRHQGIGQALIQRMKTVASDRQMAMVAAVEDPTRSVFEKVGFQLQEGFEIVTEYPVSAAPEGAELTLYLSTWDPSQSSTAETY